MSDVARLRQAATELRAIGLRLSDRECSALRRAVLLAQDQKTWAGPFVAAYADNLSFQESGVGRAGEALVQLAGWLDQVADQREAACVVPVPITELPLPPGAP